MVVWRYDPMFDIEIPAHTVAKFPQEEAETVYHHAEYLPERQAFRLGNDADIFMNHSYWPSLLDRGDEMVASRGLEVGDELTCNYCQVNVVGFTNEVSNGCFIPDVQISSRRSGLFMARSGLKDIRVGK